jgi:hypothetical protein
MRLDHLFSFTNIPVKEQYNMTEADIKQWTEI